MKFKIYTLLVFKIGFLCLTSQEVFPENIKLDIGTIYTTSPKQLIKEFTSSHYIFLTSNDFDRDGVMETIVGANCAEQFCENFIFKHLNNKRYQYLGQASFSHETYELVWKSNNSIQYPDIIFFKAENIGQGCLGRYQYVNKLGYQLSNKICRLPIAIKSLLNSNIKEIDANKKQDTQIKIKDLDAIDFSDLKYDDKLEDFFSDDESKLENKTVPKVKDQ